MENNYVVYLIDINRNETEIGMVPNKADGAHCIQDFMDRYHYQPRELHFEDLPNGDIQVIMDEAVEYFLMRLLIK